MKITLRTLEKVEMKIDAEPSDKVSSLFGLIESSVLFLVNFLWLLFLARRLATASFSESCLWRLFWRSLRTVCAGLRPETEDLSAARPSCRLAEADFLGQNARGLADRRYERQEKFSLFFFRSSCLANCVLTHCSVDERRLGALGVKESDFMVLMVRKPKETASAIPTPTKPATTT
jgi:hypothetical protein